MIGIKEEVKMELRLGDSYTGVQVLEAFLEAISKMDRWEMGATFGEPIQTPSGLSYREGAIAYATCEVEEKRGFFGPKEKVRRRGGLRINLEPLVVDDVYTSVHIIPAIPYIYGMIEACEATNPLSAEFKPALPDYEKFMSEFYSALSKKNAAAY